MKSEEIFAIIPDLVSVQFDYSVNDFLLGRDWGECNRVNNPLDLHYTVRKWSELDQSRTSSLTSISGNYSFFENGNLIVYKRHFWKMAHGFEFAYDVSAKTFYFNCLYGWHHVTIGDIFTSGRHLFHIIQVDLIMRGYVVLLSSCFIFDGRTTVILAKSKNGKTSITNHYLNRGAQYISENFSIIKPADRKVFGTYPIFKNKNRKSNKELSAILSQDCVPLQNSVVDRFIYISRHDLISGEFWSEYISLTSLNFLKNNFILNYIFYHFSFEELHGNINKIVQNLEKSHVDQIVVKNQIFSDVMEIK